MQRMFDAGCSAKKYAIQRRDFPYPDLTGELCPHCRADLLCKHGFYERYLILINFEGKILIRRYICKQCGHTVSLLPSFAHPGRAYGVNLIINILSKFYVRGRRVCDVSASSNCSRQLIRWFRRRMEQNLNMLIMELVAILPSRAPPKREKAVKKRARQFFKLIQRLNPEDISLKIFEHTRKTYLSPLTE